MGNEITTTEAAQILGVTKHRVRALIHAENNPLPGRKVGRDWLVDEMAVRERVKTVNKKGGRPRKTITLED
jgi:excisionase family DNA binding protein